MNINFSNIRTHDGSKNSGFEELVCQLAHLQIPNNGVRFVKKEGSGGDAGVECYWTLDDGSEICWQAKYFSDGMNSSRWQQLDKSFKTALEKHPNLATYVISMPLDKSDSRKTGVNGKKVVSVEDEWNKRVIEWKEIAEKTGREIEFIYWGKHEITSFLAIDNPLYSGRALYWFNEPVLGFDTFRSLTSRSKDNLGDRYTPESHIDLPVMDNFDALCETSKWWERVEGKNNKLIEQQEHFSRKFENKKDLFLEKEWVESLEDLSLNITTLNSRSIKNRNLLENLNKIRNLCIELLKLENTTVKDKNGVVTENRNLFSGDYGVIGNLFYSYKDFVHFLDSKLVKISRIRGALLHGEAGIGKSHLLCDLSLHRIDQNRPTVFLLGQRYEGGNPLNTLKSELDLSSHTNMDVLGALDAAGEASKGKTLIIIDAINEGPHRDDWHNHIRAFLTDISKYPNISLLLSCRTSYLNYILPNSVNEDCLVRIHHLGFQGYEHRAAEKYMSKQGIFKPSAPILAPEFTNPLFLKTCCQALKESGVTSFPKGMHGLTQLFDLFLQSIEKTVSKRKKYNPSEQIIKIALKDFASRLFPSNFSGLPTGEARKLINSYDPNENKGDSLFDELLYEGLLSEDISYNDKGNSYPVVRFTYERFSDHFIAQQIIWQYDENTISNIYVKNEPLGKIIINNEFHRYKGIFEALSIVIAEKYTLELVDLLPKGYERFIDDWTLEGIFTEAITWRSPESFTDRTLQILNNLQGHGFSSPTIEILLKVSTEPNHPWNADLLYKNLINKSMSERDHFWSIHIALGDQFEEDGEAESIVRTLIEWSCFGEIRSIEKERARLCATTLFWFLTTSNRKVRDQATKSLVRLLSIHSELLPELLNKFHSVNDLYLVERLYAVTYGVVCNIDNNLLITEISKTVYNLVFKHGEIIPHVLLRDYARGILEYASHLELISKDIDPEKFRPPYKSKWPIDNPSKEDIDKIDGNDFSSHIKSSLMGFPGDFGNYTMRCIHDWSATPLSEPRSKTGSEYKKEFANEFLKGDIKRQYLNKIKPEKRSTAGLSDTIFRVVHADEKEINKKRRQEKMFTEKIEEDLNEEQKEYYRWLSGLSNDRPAAFSRKWAQRWICKRAYEFGWSEKLFSGFEKKCSYGRGGNPSSRAMERIGKKYQWIALHEFLAHLSDNVYWIDRGYSDIEDKKYYGPWQLHKRDIDPTLWIRKNGEYRSYYNKVTTWWQPYSFSYSGIEKISDKLDFLWDEDKIPDFSKILRITEPDTKIDWTVLRGFWSEKQRKSQARPDNPRLDCWFRVNTIIIRKEDYKRVEKSLKKQTLVDPHTVNIPSTHHQGYLGEYPWHPVSKFMSGWYNFNGSLEGTIPTKHFIPVSKYEWEAGSEDYSLDNSLSFYLPAKELVESLDLKRSPGDFGSWKDDSQTIFRDPSINEYGPSYALMNSQCLNDWLDKNELEILWLIGGEKQLFSPGIGASKFYGRLIYSGLFRLLNNKFNGSLWFERQESDSTIMD